VSPLLTEKYATLYASYIGILQWAVELTRVDLTQSVALMSRYRSAPREGHMDAVLHIFGYIKSHDRSRLVLDWQYRDWSNTNWSEGADWKEFYPDAEEALPPGAPEPLGGDVQLNVFCDAAHAACLSTRSSTTGILVFLNGGPIKWYSKRQNTVESSTVEMNDGIRYKLWMMGVPISGATNMFGDNASVIRNVTHPESTLSKRHNSIAYHKCRESCSSGAVRIAFESGKANCSDGLTKALVGTPFRNFCRSVLM
jgi:hypothetical protein